MHAHAEEQIAFVLEGEIEAFEIAGKRQLSPGMGVSIPAWVPHAAARTLPTASRSTSSNRPGRRLWICCALPSPTKQGESAGECAGPDGKAVAANTVGDGQHGVNGSGQSLS